MPVAPAGVRRRATALATSVLLREGLRLLEGTSRRERRRPSSLARPPRPPRPRSTPLLVLVPSARAAVSSRPRCTVEQQVPPLASRESRHRPCPVRRRRRLPRLSSRTRGGTCFKATWRALHRRLSLGRSRRPRHSAGRRRRVGQTHLHRTARRRRLPLQRVLRDARPRLERLEVRHPSSRSSPDARRRRRLARSRPSPAPKARCASFLASRLSDRCIVSHHRIPLAQQPRNAHSSLAAARVSCETQECSLPRRWSRRCRLSRVPALRKPLQIVWKRGSCRRCSTTRNLRSERSSRSGLIAQPPLSRFCCRPGSSLCFCACTGCVSPPASRTHRTSAPPRLHLLLETNASLARFSDLARAQRVRQPSS